MTPVGEGQMEDLVCVLPQSLDLHAWDAVKQTPELPVPRHRRCQTEDPGVIYSINTHKHRVVQVVVTDLGVAAQRAVCGSSCRKAPSTGTHLWRRPATVCRSDRLSARHCGADA